MEIYELRIGNYVLRKNIPNEYLKVLSIDSIKNTAYLDLDGLGIMEKISNLEPILLTEELFLKNGFEKDPLITQYHREIDECLISYIVGANGCLLSIHGKKSQYYKYDIKNIHELQNSFYSLTGKELEINL